MNADIAPKSQISAKKIRREDTKRSNTRMGGGEDVKTSKSEQKVKKKDSKPSKDPVLKRGKSDLIQDGKDSHVKKKSLKSDV